MPKVKISEFSSTPANNTDIDSINISEGCAPSGINDAIRELMAQLKDFQTGAVGDSFNGPIGTSTAAAGAFTTLSASGTATLSGLTASTALALDASKNIVSVTNTGTGSNVLATSPTLVTPALGTPSSGVVTNLTGTASININGTVGATTASTGAFTTLAASSTVTLSGGTANGVTYLNGSKVVTSGSDLTFDGSTFLTTASLVDVNGVSLYPTLRFRSSNNTSTTFIVGRDSGASFFTNSGNTPFYWSINGSEGMRLTSTGLGIGTSSPAQKLSVASGATSQTAFFSSTSTTAYGATGYNGAGARLTLVGGNASGATTGINFTQGGSFEAYFGGVQEAGGAAAFVFQGYSGAEYAERMRLDSSGNLGLGVTPTNNTLGKTLQVGQAGAWVAESGSNRWWLANNWYFNSGDKYINNGFATLYSQQNGTHQWQTAPSGTAGNAISFSQVMTLDSAGTLFVGTTARPAGVGGGDNGKLWVKQTTTGNYGITAIASATDSFTSIANNGTVGIIGTSYGTTGSYLPLAFYTSDTERARITSGGDLLVGATATSSFFDGKLNVAGRLHAKTDNGANPVGFFWNTNTTADNGFTGFYTEATGTLRGSITYNRAGGLVVYNTTSDYRAKDIYGPVTDSGALIDATPVYMGKMKGATQERPMFIAHEVPAYAHTGVKDAVDADGNPVYQQMDASALIPVMWAELQSLRARVAQLESN